MEQVSVERLYNIRAVCTVLGAPRVTVIRWIREKKLHAFKIGGGRMWRIRESELARFINNGKGGEQ